MRALVLGGAGAVCQETVRDLAAYSDFAEIVIADLDLAAVERLLADIGDDRLQPLAFDARDYEAMLRLFPGFDVVVNGLPFQFDLTVNKACVEAGVNGLDLSSDDPQFALHEQAVARGVTFVPGMGATPGTTNLMVRRAAEQLDRIEAVDIYFAAFRCLAPAPGLLATTIWEFKPDQEERKAVYYEDGTWHPAPPLSGGKTIRFHPAIGEQDVYYVPHDEANTLPRSYPGLRRATVRGCFPPQVMALMSALLNAGLLSDRRLTLAGAEVTALEAVRALLASSPTSQENATWAYGLVVEVRGVRQGRGLTCTYRNQHPPQKTWGGRAAYFKNVGIPLSIGAQLIASGQATAAGVRPPELAIPTAPFFRELARRGIVVEETIVEESILEQGPI